MQEQLNLMSTDWADEMQGMTQKCLVCAMSLSLFGPKLCYSSKQSLNIRSLFAATCHI